MKTDSSEKLPGTETGIGGAAKTWGEPGRYNRESKVVYGSYQNENAQNDHVFRRKKGFPFLNSKLNEREKGREREGCTEEAGGNKVLQEGGS